MSTPDPNNANERRWSSEQWIQLIKESVTALVGLAIVLYTLYIAGQTFVFVGDEKKIADAKDVLLLLLGLAGVVVGYYFGRVPADARTTQAQQHADAANARAEQVSARAEAAADQVDAILDKASEPAAAGARRAAAGAGEAQAPPEEELKRVRDTLRGIAAAGRLR